MNSLENVIQEVAKKYPDGPEAAYKEIMRRWKDDKIIPNPSETQFLFVSELMGWAPLEVDIHRHQCPNCKTIWQHDRAKIPDGEDAYKAAHTCPKGCGTDVRERYVEPATNSRYPND